MRTRYIAACWLKLEKRCLLVMHERSPRTWHCGIPDVFGVNANRFTFEIEIKRSMSDFRANSKKRHIQHGRFSDNGLVAAKHLEMAPKQFWFLVTEDMVEKCKNELPDYAGLMTIRRGFQIEVVKQAPINSMSKKISLKEGLVVMRNAGAQIVSMMDRVSSHGWENDLFCLDDFHHKSAAEYPELYPLGYSNFQI